VPNLLPLETDLPAIMDVDAVDAVEERCLSRPIGTHQAGDFTSVKVKRHTLHRLETTEGF
jgi:hypothetical protein